MDSQALLARRMAEATPQDTMMGLFVETSLEYMSRTLDTQIVEGLRREIIGEKRLLTDSFRCPVLHLLKVVSRVVTTQEIAVECSSLMEQLGRAAVLRFMDSHIGKAMAMIGRGRPNSLLESAPTAYMPVASFGERTYARLNEKSGLTTFTRDLLGPSWGAGVYKQVLETMCQVKAKVTVELRNESGSDFAIKVEW